MGGSCGSAAVVGRSAKVTGCLVVCGIGIDTSGIWETKLGGWVDMVGRGGGGAK